MPDWMKMGQNWVRSLKRKSHLPRTSEIIDFLLEILLSRPTSPGVDRNLTQILSFTPLPTMVGFGPLIPCKISPFYPLKRTSGAKLSFGVTVSNSDMVQAPRIILGFGLISLHTLHLWLQLLMASVSTIAIQLLCMSGYRCWMPPAL